MNRHSLELMCYGINGIVSTAIHFAVLTINLQVLLMPSAGLANLVASLFGISTSFIGNRYFVFSKSKERLLAQAAKFASLYSIFAFAHGAVLFLWTDWLNYDFRQGFLLSTMFQIAASYFGNKYLVFRK